MPGRKPMVMDRAAVGKGWCRERAEHQGETSKKIQIPSLRPAGGFVSFAGVGTGRMEPRLKTDLIGGQRDDIAAVGNNMTKWVTPLL